MLARRDTRSNLPTPSLDEKLRALASAVAHPLQTWHWLQFLKRDPLLRQAARASLPLLMRVHRPYLSRHFSCGERVAMATGHYRHLRKAGFDGLLQQALREPVHLAGFTGKSGRQYALKLSALEPGRQDGELILRLVSGELCVYSAGFVVTGDDRPRCVMLGGLRGMLATGHSFGIKQVTRDLYGLRPKELMVDAVREIGACIGCSNTVLVGNDNKVPDERRHYCRKSADYDRSWREMQAHRRDDGDFELPCAPRRAQAQSTAAREANGAAPARMHLLDTVRASLQASLNAFRSGRQHRFGVATTASDTSREAQDGAGQEDLPDPHEHFSRLQRSS